MLLPKFWVGYLVKRETAKIFDFCSSKGGAQTGGNGAEIVARMTLGVGGELFDVILERRDSKLFKMPIANLLFPKINSFSETPSAFG
jgi:hypothetical protein